MFRTATLECPTPFPINWTQNSMENVRSRWNIVEEQMKLFTGANQFIGFYHVKDQEEIANSIDFQSAKPLLVSRFTTIKFLSTFSTGKSIYIFFSSRLSKLRQFSAST